MVEIIVYRFSALNIAISLSIFLENEINVFLRETYTKSQYG